MTRLHHVKRARRAYKSEGIKRGQEYWWWQFAYGPKTRSATKPPRSRYATQSDYLGPLYDLEDGIGALDTAGELSDIAGELNSAADEVEELGSTCQSNRDNMPEHLQEVGNGELLGNRVEFCETLSAALRDAASEIEGYEDDPGDLSEATDDDIDILNDEAVQRQRDFVQEKLDDLDWSSE